MASAGTVTVDFAAETAKFTAELKKVQGSLKRMEGSFKSMEKVAGVALRVFSGAALASFAKQAFDAADATATAAERAGIAVDTFSRLQYAASQTDIEMAALTSGVQRLQIALSKADDQSAEAVASLSRFGLEAQNLRQLSIEDQLSEIAEAFQRITDPADRTRLAVDLFGKSAGPQLVPLLSQGKAGIQQLTAEADRLGITLSTTTAAGIDQADRAIKQLTSTLSAYTSKFIAGLSIAILGPPDDIQKIDLEMRRIQARMEQIRQGVGGGDPAAVLGRENPLVKELAALRAEFEILLAQKEALYSARAPSTGVTASAEVSPIQEIDIAAIQAMKIEVDELGEAYKRLAEATAAVQAAQVADALEISTAGMAEARRQVEEQITRDLEFQLQARNALESHYRNQRYQEDVEYAVAREKLEQGTLNSVLGALRAFAGGSKKIAIALVAANKAVAIAQAIQATSVAVMKALQFYGPTPQGFAAAAAAKALGAVQIAAIVASGIGEARSIRGAGGAPIGSPVNPVVTTPASSDADFGAESQRAVQVIIANNVGFDQRVMDQIISGIREATDDRDVIIFGPESRQAKEIVGG
jgi:intracellular sulfur oxidation DsrE/DsrF family protein